MTTDVDDRVLNAMLDGRWRTIEDVCRIVPAEESTVRRALNRLSRDGSITIEYPGGIAVYRHARGAVMFKSRRTHHAAT